MRYDQVVLCSETFCVGFRVSQVDMLVTLHPSPQSDQPELGGFLFWFRVIFEFLFGSFPGRNAAEAFRAAKHIFARR